MFAGLRERGNVGSLAQATNGSEYTLMRISVALSARPFVLGRYSGNDRISGRGEYSGKQPIMRVRTGALQQIEAVADYLRAN